MFFSLLHYLNLLGDTHAYSPVPSGEFYIYQEVLVWSQISFFQPHVIIYKLTWFKWHIKCERKLLLWKRTWRFGKTHRDELTKWECCWIICGEITEKIISKGRGGLQWQWRKNLHSDCFANTYLLLQNKETEIGNLRWCSISVA